MMFTRFDLNLLDKQRLTNPAAFAHYPDLRVVTYGQDDFQCRDAEEIIRICTAPKRTGDNGLYFWLAAECTEGWQGRERYFASYVGDAAFEAISESDFNQLVANYCAHLRILPKLPLYSSKGSSEGSSKGFVGALLMYSARTDLMVSAVAEYEDSFIHFYWDTTA
jgi:hypothetical protein